jgi:hypothetical protein
MNAKVASYNSRIRLLLFFARPLHIYCVVLLFQLWNYMSFAPEKVLTYHGTPTAVVEMLWRDVFSGYVWYFIVAAALDIAAQEFLPLILPE